MVEALKSFLGDAKEDVASLFDAVLQKEDIERLLVILINRLDIDSQILVVLDDFHFINDIDLLQNHRIFYKALLRQYQPGAAYKEEPGLYLGDLIIAGKLLQIKDEDLRLSENEGMVFLKNTLQVDKKRSKPEGNDRAVGRLDWRPSACSPRICTKGRRGKGNKGAEQICRGVPDQGDSADAFRRGKGFFDQNFGSRIFQ